MGGGFENMVGSFVNHALNPFINIYKIPKTMISRKFNKVHNSLAIIKESIDTSTLIDTETPFSKNKYNGKSTIKV